MTPQENATIRRALYGYASACRNRANEIAQDTKNMLRGSDGKPIPKDAVGMALDEAALAEKLIAQFTEAKQ